MKRYGLVYDSLVLDSDVRPVDGGDYCLYSDTEALRSRNEELEEELASKEAELRSGTYRGNSVGFIYDKMTCYGDQVRMAFNALRTLGWVDDCRDNDQRRISIELWTQETAGKWTDVERLDWLDRPWVRVLRFPDFGWMNDKTEAHPDSSVRMSPLSLRAAIDAARDAERPVIEEVPAEQYEEFKRGYAETLSKALAARDAAARDAGE